MVKQKPAGRVCVKRKQRIPLSFERSAYKIDLKLAVLAYWKNNDMECTLKKFWPNELEYESKRKMLYRWKAKLTETPVLRESKLCKELGVSVIWNADQTPVNFEMLPRKTVDDKGVRTVWVRCAGKEKERVSVMLFSGVSYKRKGVLL